MVSQDFLQEYVEEAREHLQELEGSLLVLEREGTNKEEIGQIFRAAHSIKGASAYMGFEQLANLTHEMESFISEIQNNLRPVAHEEISTLLECVDFISQALRHLQEKGEEPNLPVALMENLHDVRTGKGRGKPEVTEPTPPPPEPEHELLCEDLFPEEPSVGETTEQWSGDLELASLSPAVSGEEIQEEDEELFGIFMNTFQELFSELCQVHIASPEVLLPQDGLQKAQDLIQRLINSSQYMDYEQIVSLLKQLGESLLQFSQAGLADGYYYSQLMCDYGERLRRILPRLTTPAPQDLIQKGPEEPGTIHEEDEELFNIFMDSFGQLMAEISGLTPSSVGTRVANEDYEKILELIRKLISSSQYMDYERVVEVLAEWEDSLLVLQQDGDVDSQRIAELFVTNAKKLHELLPALETKEAIGFEAIEEEDQELLNIFLDSFRQHFSQLSSLSPLSRERLVSTVDCERALELIRKLISSSQYMDYEQIVDVLRDWEGSLQGLHQSGGLDGHHYLELLKAFEQRLNKVLPGLEVTAAVSSVGRESLLEGVDLEIDMALEELEAAPVPVEATAEQPPGEEDLNESAKRAVEAWEIREKIAEPAEKALARKARTTGSMEESATAATLRVDAQKVDQLLNQVGELVVTRSEFIQTNASFRDMLRELSAQGKLSKQELRKLRSLTFRLNESTQSLGRVSSDLQNSIMRIRMLPIANLFQRFPRVVRDQALKVGKAVEMVVEGDDTEIDKRVLEQMNDPIVQLLRNAIAHGVESPEERSAAGKPEAGAIRLAAYHEGDYVVIEVEDDGRGIDTQKLKAILQSRKGVNAEQLDRLSDHEIMYAIFLPGISTHDRVDGTAGRGVGLDVVKENLERMNGTIEVESFPGAGTRFTIRIPLTVAIIRALMVRSADNVFALPLNSVSEIVRYEHDKTHTIEGFRVTSLRGKTVPLLNLSQLLNMPTLPAENGHRFIIIVTTSFREVGLVVDSLMGEREVVIKPIEDDYHDFEGFSGATILGDGKVSLILDVSALLRTMKTSLQEHQMPMEFYTH